MYPHYTRGITPKHATSGEAHLRGLAPSQLRRNVAAAACQTQDFHAKSNVLKHYVKTGRLSIEITDDYVQGNALGKPSHGIQKWLMLDQTQIRALYCRS